MEVVHFSAKGSRISYFFALTSKYTFIRGKSGIGKTTLLKLIDDDAYHVDHNYKLVSLPSKEDIGFLILNSYMENSKVIFYADEDYEYMHHLSFQRLMQEAKGLFLIVHRNPFNSLSYAASDIVTVDGTFRHDTSKPYARSNFPVNYAKVKNVVVEDSKSGLHFFQSIFSGIESSGGNTQVAGLIYKRRNTLFVLDEFGAGSVIKSIAKALRDNEDRDNQLLLIDSFEAMVLKSQFLEAWTSPPINCPNKEEYATQLLISVLAQKGVTYSKSGKNPCLIMDCCFKSERCDLCAYGCKQQLIAGPIYDGLKSIQ